MSPSDVDKAAARLVELRRAAIRVEVETDQAIAAILTENQREKINEIKTGAAISLDMIDAESSRIESELREHVVQTQQSLESAGVRVSLVKDSIKWNDAELLRYASDHPEIMKFRSHTSNSPRITVPKEIL